MRSLLLLLVLLCLPPLLEARTFPATSDPTLAAQERWGSLSRGYITDGCWHRTAAGNTAQIASCRAFALETADPESLQGFEELTPRDITYSAGDGTYWLGGRSNPGVTPPSWTCLAGLHYCTRKLDTPPEAVSGLVVLGKTTVTAGAISAFSIQAPWRRTTPYTVPAGTTLTFGVCPEASLVPIFQAFGDATSGLVRFLAGACLELYPQWWGADPSGLVDSTTAWSATLGAARNTTPIACTGTYAVSKNDADNDPDTNPGDGSDNAFTLIGFQQIIGKMSPINYVGPTVVTHPCRFVFSGTGNVFGTTSGTPHNNILLKNIYIWDKGGQGARGLDLWWYAGSALDQVVIDGFHTSLWLGEQVYYGYIEKVGLTNGRYFCADLAGGAFNGGFIELECDSTSAQMIAGIRLGTVPNLYGTGHITTFRFTIETTHGIPLIAARQQGSDFNIYIEQYGDPANHSPIGAAQFINMEGNRMVMRIKNSTSGDLPVAIRFLSSGVAATNKNNRLSGHIGDRYTQPLVVDTDGGTWDMTTDGLTTAVDTLQQWGPFTGGIRLQNNVITHGGVPIANQGRGSSASVWHAGDVIWSSGGTGGPLQNVLRIVNADGNPPAGLSTILLETINAVTIAAAETTPSVKTNQIYNTRFTLEAGSNITDFLDEIPGMCIMMRALGARTIVDGAAIDLPTGNFVMSANDSITLCIESGVWRERSRTDYP